MHHSMTASQGTSLELYRSCLIRLPLRQTKQPLRAQEEDFSFVITPLPVETWKYVATHTPSITDGMTANAAVLQKSQINREEIRIGICSRVSGGPTVGLQEDGREDLEAIDEAGTTIRKCNAF